MDEVGTELEEIKREIVESRALTIKTNNLVNALAADVNSIAKRQHRAEQSLKLHSVAAYLAFVVVMLIVGKVVVDARVETERAQSKDRRDRVSQLEKELELLKSREEASVRAARQAAEFYALVVSDNRAEVLKAYPEVSKLALTKTESLLFRREYERAKNELSMSSYQEGLDHVRAERWHEAEQAFQNSLKYNPDAAHAPGARYQLGRALRTLGRQREAIPMLIRLSEASPNKEIMDDATFLLAEAQIDLAAWNDAKATLRSFIRRFPSSARINDARSKLADLQLYH